MPIKDDLSLRKPVLLCVTWRERASFDPIPSCFSYLTPIPAMGLGGNEPKEATTRFSFILAESEKLVKAPDSLQNLHTCGWSLAMFMNQFFFHL